MKKIFIDCGTHLFQGLCEFVEKYNIDSSWECYSFEANPITFQLSQDNYKTLTENWQLNIEHYNKAVYTENTKLKVNCSKDIWGENSFDYISAGSNVLLDAPDYDSISQAEFNYKDENITVDAIDFCEFLKKTCKDEDFVVIKMDIEGSEFYVLPQIIEQNLFSLIDNMSVEFHERFFEPKVKYKELKEEYIKIFSEKGIQIEEWK
jgi:FkbM family methyltransferase